ncbi:DNA/RNA helicase, DEAD/DEAH box type, N-terminal [Artemisia annua]|uniref:RNA helicase n=1 Tax=Artemisia annua TaxID=35608 RepID=A0A2U1NFW8_ARTAN|nr:DNA/RNA helicase, DEAD/DEAH box type, N-terminal [Artemisia annua]
MKRSIDDVSNNLLHANKKPVFISKAEREQQALKHLLLQEPNPNSSVKPPSDDVTTRHHRSFRDHRHRDRKREPEEENKAREKRRIERQAERHHEKELELIKEKYLGTEKPKKRVMKPSEKFRTSFDWENTEDTSDMNVLYKAREQKKLGAKKEKDIRDEIRKQDKATDARRIKDEAAKRFDKKLEEMTERDWRIFTEDLHISYKGSKIPRPMRSWVESGLSREILKAVDRAGYKKPSPIQMAAIPLGLQQRDVIGVAETGSGKTAAFVLPMLTYINRLPHISEENAAEVPYAVVSIVGGWSIEEQGFKISQGCEVLIATPGRLIDCLERRYAVLNQCNYVVLDEADRMIDKNMEKEVVRVLDAMPSSNLKPENEDEELDEKKIYRTTYMFSVTMRTDVERLARRYLRNPVVVTVGTAGKATDLITQHVIMVKESEKMSRLQMLLHDLGDKKAIVFLNMKNTVDFVSKALDKSGYRVTTLHGGKSQEQREISLDGFRTKRFNVLVATDVAGRGIDITDVVHVINYDMPGNIEQYTHCIGRTGRAGKTGTATTFLTLDDANVFYDLKQMLMQRIVRCLLNLLDMRLPSLSLDQFLIGHPDGTTKFSHIEGIMKVLLKQVINLKAANGSWDLCAKAQLILENISSLREALMKSPVEEDFVSVIP